MAPEKKILDIKMIGAIITVITLSIGLIGQWYNSQANIAQLEEDYTYLEKCFTEYKDKTDDRILQMKIDITSSSTDIASIKRDIAEIKTDIKTLLSRPR